MKKSQVKRITGYPDYGVTKEGIVVSYRRDPSGVVLAPSTTNGYEKVSLQGKKGTGNFQVHRLVAMMFLRKKKDCNIVNHIDGDKLNNKLSNLEWTTRSGNAQHYEKTIAPKYKADRKQKKHDDLATRLAIISHAQTACTSNPQLFQSIVATALNGIKL
jgi:hypothetical protein